ncbi:hypothetical protein AGMMS49975_19710 [Clostridia bacterium]|nr:hypothetical protein AGMMS49975_19710 [Clostridia bacterium]
MKKRNPEYYLPFPMRLRQLIDDNCLEQKELADFVGVTRQTISKWKDGFTIPDIYGMKKLCEFFKVPYEYILGETDSIVKENFDTSKQLGLTDRSIELMKKWTKEPYPTDIAYSEIVSDMISAGSHQNEEKYNFEDVLTYIYKSVAIYANCRYSEMTGVDVKKVHRELQVLSEADLLLLLRCKALEILNNFFERIPVAYFEKYFSENFLDDEEDTEKEKETE